jgi:hypothetical protein
MNATKAREITNIALEKFEARKKECVEEMFNHFTRVEITNAANKGEDYIYISDTDIENNWCYGWIELMSALLAKFKKEGYCVTRCEEASRRSREERWCIEW